MTDSQIADRPTNAHLLVLDVMIGRPLSRHCSHSNQILMIMASKKTLATQVAYDKSSSGLLNSLVKNY